MLDEKLKKFAERKLDEAYPYLFLDATFKKIREDGVLRTQAVFTALGVNWEGRRQILAVQISNRESKSSWKDFIIKLKE